MVELTSRSAQDRALTMHNNTRIHCRCHVSHRSHRQVKSRLTQSEWSSQSSCGPESCQIHNMWRVYTRGCVEWCIAHIFPQPWKLVLRGERQSEATRWREGAGVGMYALAKAGAGKSSRGQNIPGGDRARRVVTGQTRLVLQWPR